MEAETNAHWTAGNPDLFANLCGAYSSWVLRFPSSQVVPEPEILLIDSGTQSGEVNVGYLLRESDPAFAIDRAQKFFHGKSRPWRIEAPFAPTERVELAMQSAGLTERSPRPSFVLDRSEFRTASPSPDLTVQEVDSEESARVFMATAYEGFTGKLPTVAIPLARATVPSLSLYTGSVDGTPVATAASYRARGVVGIYAVATLERARRHGYGRAITERALRDGFESGCTVSYLQATAAGRPVYEAMGYRRVFDTVSWSAPR